MAQLDFLTAYNNSEWEEAFGSCFPVPKITDKSPMKLRNFYHYTTLSNCINNMLILHPEKCSLAKNKNNYIELWASHFLYLNDGEELHDGLKKLFGCIAYKRKEIENSDNAEKAKMIADIDNFVKQLEQIKPENISNAPNHFILCFCTNGNLLSQWKWYGRDGGIAIEFDLLNCVYDGVYSFGDLNNNEPYKTNPYAVIYDDKKKDKCINKLMNIKLHTSTDVYYWAIRYIAAASLMKHQGFEEEHEVRLIFSPLYSQYESISDSISRIKYRENDGVIKPYMKIQVKHKEENRTPINSVTVGPGKNQQLVFNALIKLIQSRFPPKDDDYSIPEVKDHEIVPFCRYTEIGGIQVRYSTIPLR